MKLKQLNKDGAQFTQERSCQHLHPRFTSYLFLPHTHVSLIYYRIIFTMISTTEAFKCVDIVSSCEVTELYKILGKIDVYVKKKKCTATETV